MLPMLLLALSAAHADPPKIVEGFILRPEFHTTKGDFNAGTAFAVELDGHLLVVTAFHLFGPPGGLPAQVLAAELPAYATGVTVRDAWSGAEVGEFRARNGPGGRFVRPPARSRTGRPEYRPGRGPIDAATRPGAAWGSAARRSAGSEPRTREAQETR